MQAVIRSTSCTIPNGTELSRPRKLSIARPTDQRDWAGAPNRPEALSCPGFARATSPAEPPAAIPVSGPFRPLDESAVDLSADITQPSLCCLSQTLPSV